VPAAPRLAGEGLVDFAAVAGDGDEAGAAELMAPLLSEKGEKRGNKALRGEKTCRERWIWDLMNRVIADVRG